MDLWVDVGEECGKRIFILIGAANVVLFLGGVKKQNKRFLSWQIA